MLLNSWGKAQGELFTRSFNPLPTFQALDIRLPIPRLPQVREHETCLSDVVLTLAVTDLDPIVLSDAGRIEFRFPILRWWWRIQGGPAKTLGLLRFV